MCGRSGGPMIRSRKSLDEDPRGGGWGGYMESKTRKLREQFEENRINNEAKGPEKLSDIFHGISIWVNGYTTPTSNELKKLMALHGGVFEYYYSVARVSHVIATTLPDQKIKDLTSAKIVHPRWITDSISAGKLLPYKDFLLYTAHDLPGQSRIAQFLAQSTPAPTPTATAVGGAASATPAPSTGALNANTSWRAYDRRDTRASADALTEAVVASMVAAPGAGRGSGTGVAWLSAPSMPPPAPSTTSPARDASAMPSPPAPRTPVAHGMPPPPAATSPFAEDTPPPPQPQPRPPPPPQATTTSRPRLLRSNSDEMEGVVVTSTDDFPPSPPELRKSRAAAQFESPTRPPRHPPISDSVRAAEARDAASMAAATAGGAGGANNGAGQQRPVKPVWGKGLSTKDNPNFAADFYRQSRLSFLSTWKAKIRRELSEMCDEFCHHMHMPTDVNDRARIVAHIDMDCFFASVALREKPHLVGLPVVVAHSLGGQIGSSSEIASASYEARKYNLRNGMFVGEARRLCPNLVVVPYDFDAYKEVSIIMYKVFLGFTNRVMAISCDEAYLDITGLGEPLDVARDIRAQILAETRCPSSVGVGQNMLLARIGTGKAKPNGMYHLKEDDVMSVMGPLPLTSLPGIGWSLGARLEASGYNTCSDVWRTNQEHLQSEFGPKTGVMLWTHARGIDERQLQFKQPRKSVGTDINWGVRFTEVAQVHEFIQSIANEVHTRLAEGGWRGKTITYKLKERHPESPVEPAKFLGCGMCIAHSRAVTLGFFTDDPAVLARECTKIYQTMNIPPHEIRGMGLTVSRLESEENKIPELPKNQRTLNFERPAAPTSDDDEAPADEGPGEEMDFEGPAENAVPYRAVAAKHTVTAAGDEWGDIQASQMEDDDPSMGRGASRAKKATSMKPKRAAGPAPARAPAARAGWVDTSLSDIDPAALSELPEDIRREIEAESKRQAAFNARQEKTVQPPKKKGRGNGGQVKKPPAKEKKPAAKAAAKPKFKMPTRPVPKKETGGQATLTQLHADTQAIVKRLPSVDPEVFKALPRIIQMEILHQMPPPPKEEFVDASDGEEEEELPHKARAPHSNEPVDPYPHLRGSIDELRCFLTEWMSSRELPSIEDISLLAEYVGDAVKARDADRARLVALHVRRYAGEHAAWVEGFNLLLGHLQECVQRTYGARLVVQPLEC